MKKLLGALLLKPLSIRIIWRAIHKLCAPGHPLETPANVYQHELFCIFQEIRLKLGFKLRLTDLLIKPIQRLTKYHMLLEAILKYSQRAGLADEAAALTCAFHVMTVVPNQANEMMDIGRLQGFEVSQYKTYKLLPK